MSADDSASVFCFRPQRLAVNLIGTASPSSLPTNAASAPAAACSAPALPLGPCPVCPRLAQEFEPYRLANYWKAMHHGALQRLAEAQQERAQTQAKLRLRAQQLCGRQTETSAATTATTATAKVRAGRQRGQQRGWPGPGRRDPSHLPVVVEDQEIPGTPVYGHGCGRPFAPLSGTEDATILEIEVKA